MPTLADVTRHRQLDPEMDAIFRRAEANDSVSAPRKHHLVPASYLRRWQGSARTIRMTETTSRRSVLVSPQKALKQTDFYRLESPDLEPGVIPPLLMETILAEVESQAKRILDGLISVGRCDSPDDEAALAWFLAMQITRGASFRAEQATAATEGMKLQMSDLTDSGIRDMLLARGEPAADDDVARARKDVDDVLSGEIFFAPQDAAATAMSARLAMDVGEYLLHREWLVYRAPYGGLITCDEPVVLVPAPGDDRLQRAGVATAGAVLLALDPYTVLAMFHPAWRPSRIGRVVDLLPTEVGEINLEIAANSHRWLIEEPNTRTTLSLPLPPPAAPFQQEGPLPGFSGEGELYRSFKPNRWAYSASPPPLPVGRWWE